MNEHLIIKNLHKKFGEVQAVKDVSLQIKQGELLTLLGRSGCGKTTTLQMIAGFHMPDHGEILLNGRNITYEPAYRRKTPLVFQEYALFPHLNVFENIAYGLKVQKMNRKTIRDKVKEILNRLGLAQTMDRFPNQLSGGQQQRIALARALVLNPEVLLLDEPLSNLDAKLRIKVRYEISELRRQFNITTVFVTHDQEEALSISDKIAVMNHGVVEQFGHPLEIYYHPQNEFVAGFIGETNFLKVEIVDIRKEGNKAEVNFRWKDRIFKVMSEQTGLNNGQEKKMLLRPEAIDIKAAVPAQPVINQISGLVKQLSFLGAITRYWVDIGGELLIIDDSGFREHGYFSDQVRLSFKERSIHFL